MNILVTGATGFIGRHLCARLTEEHEVHALIRPSSDPAVLPDGCNTMVFNGDVAALRQAMCEAKIDGIVHLAARYVAEHSPEQICDLIHTNLFFGTAVLDCGVKAGVDWFVNIGTIWQNYNSADYKDEYNPVNLYAATKQSFLTLARYYQETSPIRFVTLKLCDTYGENDTRRKIMDLFAQVAETGRELDMSGGEQLIDIVHVSVVVREIERLIAALADRNCRLREEYVVTSGHPVTLRALAKQYEEEHNVRLNINWGARPYRLREVMVPYVGNRLPDMLD